MQTVECSSKTTYWVQQIQSWMHTEKDKFLLNWKSWFEN